MGTKGIGIGVVVFMVATSSLARADDSPEDKKLAIEAAKALYGEGLTIKRAGGKVTIEPKAGGLTQEKYNLFVEKFYLPAVITVPWSRQGAAFRWGPDDWRYKDKKFEPSAKGRLAYVLLEPFLKAHVCWALMNRGGDTPDFAAKRDNRDWCIWQGMVESTRPIFEYRGEAVTWDDKRERGDIAIDEPLWEKKGNDYPMVVTVAGSREVITSISIQTLRLLAPDIDGDGKNGPKAKAHSAKVFTAYEKLEKAVAAKQKKLLGKNRVALADKPFTEWEAVTPMTTGMACDKVSFIAYTPPGETFFIAMKVDGSTCAYYTTDGNHTDRDTPRWFERCWDRLSKTGSHKVDIEIQEMIKGGGSYSRLEIRDNKIKDIKYDVIDSGKKLFGGSGTCESK